MYNTAVITVVKGNSEPDHDFYRVSAAVPSLVSVSSANPSDPPCSRPTHPLGFSSRVGVRANRGNSSPLAWSPVLAVCNARSSLHWRLPPSRGATERDPGRKPVSP